ncbi:MAG: UDP-3-O-(3-hydroxymyristoyl)glucosamine N-acyltransferase [Elusimicrobia bacterium]|nr:UDP-3-O-(3-hydroxymyristoyl)glucosamine N-acyltransferase [Elusimicrobiota bacterium]
MSSTRAAFWHTRGSHGGIIKVEELARLLGGEIKGEPGFEIKGLRDIERLSPEQPLEDGYLYFIESKAVLKRHPLAAANGVILTTAELADQFPRAIVVSGDARLAFFQALSRFDRAPAFAPGVGPKALVDLSARIDPTASVLDGAVVMARATVGPACVIYPGAVIEPDATVGEGTVIRSNAVIGHGCMIGKRCLIHSATVIGADGFGFYDRPGARHKVPHIGNVVIADDVEIGASSTVDRATIESTTIGQFTKIDDQVHVGHNCSVGRFVYLTGNSAIGGSVVIEDGAMISGMVIVKDHLRIAAGSIVLGMSGVAQDTEPKQIYFGIPARNAREMHKMNAALAKLPEMLVKFRELEATLAEKAS